MEIIQRHGIAFKVLEKIGPPYDRPRLQQSRVLVDILCEDLTSLYSDPNTRNIVLITDNPTKPIMTYQDILDEIVYIKRTRFRSEDLRSELILYYQKIVDTMKAYKRQEQINKVLNSNECTFHLAC